MEPYLSITGKHVSFNSETAFGSILKYTQKDAYGCGYSLNIDGVYIGLDDIIDITLWNKDHYKTIYNKNIDYDLTEGDIKKV